MYNVRSHGSVGYVGFLLPSRTGTKILEVFSSSVVSVRVPNVYLSES